VKESGGSPAWSAVSKANNLAWGVTLGASWLWTWKQLSLGWSGYPNYEFGFFVPWIAVLLALRRIRATPGCLERVSASHGVGRLLAGVAVAWGLFFFAELVREFDPHWRMVGGMMMASVTLLTGVWLWQRGGKRLLGTLAFPVAFAWTAVPWPTNIEEFVTLKLRAFVTMATVEAMHAMGIHAVQHGNIIDLTNGSVLVDSACSGISSFQASIMASLFLGEYFRFSAWRRWLLVGAGSVLAVGGNLVRTTVLVRVANDWGAATLMAYHDRLGVAETVGIFIALVTVAWCISLNSPRRESVRLDTPTGTLEGTPRGIWAGRDGWAVLLAFGFLPLIIQGWFALSPGGPVRRQEAPLWLLNVKPVAADWREEPVTLSPMDIRTLGFTEGQTISLAGPSDTNATIYHFFWKTDASTGFGHTPDSCMRGGGWKEQGEPVQITMRIKDKEFPGKLYWFKQDGEEDVVVFQSIWYGGEPMLSQNEFPYAKGGPRTSRLEMLWEEPRRRGLEALNVYMAPAGSQEAQTRVAGEILAQVLAPNGGN